MRSSPGVAQSTETASPKESRPSLGPVLCGVLPPASQREHPTRTPQAPAMTPPMTATCCSVRPASPSCGLSTLAAPPATLQGGLGQAQAAMGTVPAWSPPPAVQVPMRQVPCLACSSLRHPRYVRNGTQSTVGRGLRPLLGGAGGHS